MADTEDLFSVFDVDDEECSSKTKVSKKSSSPSKEYSKPGKSQEEDDFVASLIHGKRTCSDDEEEASTKKLKTADLLDEINLDDYLPRIQIHTVETVEACLHEVAVPHDAEYVPLRAPSSTPAKEYQFILDPFQKEAILCLENNQSVLVSAHTSAGKTVVAEYAVSMSLRSKQRVIYTTPIKALSNQKYREFYEEFKDVGLMTGDVTINPSASCLIMTTEILRSMLYRGSEVMREVGWVIFDEIHYMRDKERGVVWEETIILLPDTVHYVFLSATIPNARQFAEWICHLHKQPCHVVYTDYRPTPLQHYIFPSGGDGLHLVVDEQGVFKEENFNTAMSVLQNVGDAGKGDKNLKGRKGGFKGESNCFKIVKMIMERNMAPVIVFSFSRKECEAYAMQMSRLDFNSVEEKHCVQEVFDNALDILSDEDKKLPQVEHVLPLLLKGIGIHHSGLLPILKEVIEILFAEGLIKALFATETFAMGLNMPARTVLFTSARKFDGREFRWVSSGEYIQMSGRAGRRGIDDKGIIILMVDEKMSPSVGKEIVKGQPDPINSAFHLTYNMVLNLLRVEGINPEYMLERSFFQFQNYASIPQFYDKLKKLQTEHDSLIVERESDVAAYYKIRQTLDQLSEEFHSYLINPKYIVPFLNPGRMVYIQSYEVVIEKKQSLQTPVIRAKFMDIRHYGVSIHAKFGKLYNLIKKNQDDFGWGIVINYTKKAPNKSNPSENSAATYVVDVLMHVNKESAQTKQSSNLKPPSPGEKGEMQVIPIVLDLIHKISAVRLFYPQDLRPLENRMSVLKSVKETQKRFNNKVPLLNPIEDLNIKDKGFGELVKKIETYEDNLYTNSLHKDKDLESLYNTYEQKSKLALEVKAVKQDLKKAKSLLQMEELKCRKRVLRRLGYCTSSDVIEIKGRVACEISSADELLMTEMIFNGAFNNLNSHQAAALVSCFVFQEKSNEMPKLTDELSGPLRQMQEMARRIAKVSNEAKLSVEEDHYVESFRPHLMDVVYAWSKGANFSHICKMTDVFEGSVIRCMRRLEELLRQMCQAAKGIGNTELENKFSEAIKVMKRDIVFAASLYL